MSSEHRETNTSSYKGYQEAYTKLGETFGEIWNRFSGASGALKWTVRLDGVGIDGCSVYDVKLPPSSSDADTGEKIPGINVADDLMVVLKRPSIEVTGMDIREELQALKGREKPILTINEITFQRGRAFVGYSIGWEAKIAFGTLMLPQGPTTPKYKAFKDSFVEDCLIKAGVTIEGTAAEILEVIAGRILPS